MGRINSWAQKKKNKVFLNKKRKKQRKEYNLSNKKKKKYIRFFETEGIETKVSGIRSLHGTARLKNRGLVFFPTGWIKEGFINIYKDKRRINKRSRQVFTNGDLT